MTGIVLYGIPNCDTVRKARKWMDGEGVPYRFHDYRKDGTDPERLAGWVRKAGRDTLLNRRGTTWRKLPDTAKDGIDDDGAVALMAEHPALIKRPVVEHAGGLMVGFDEAEWRAALL
ncbi:ArsC family reductase [Croceicoccus hydrothermalis]|uniref:ArsC family reductase n=1 Tax=Croceicoccus hydrothermalis TaxID=2867964 RepID=UPI001EFBF0E1|nr:ArsC family reductase [Croceicoccus hydrothermalis]